eukprot:356096-Chlamydomonas_euryale.AAC.3
MLLRLLVPAEKEWFATQHSPPSTQQVGFWHCHQHLSKARSAPPACGRHTVHAGGTPHGMQHVFVRCPPLS